MDDPYSSHCILFWTGKRRPELREVGLHLWTTGCLRTEPAASLPGYPHLHLAPLPLPCAGRRCRRRGGTVSPAPLWCPCVNRPKLQLPRTCVFRIPHLAWASSLRADHL